MLDMGRHWAHRRVPRGGVPGLEADRRVRRSSKGEGCEILDQGLIGLIGYSYQQVATSFPGAHLKRTARLSVFGPEHSQGWVTMVNLFLVVQSIQTKATQHIQRTLFVWPVSLHSSRYRSEKQVGFQLHWSSSLTTLHLNLARGHVKKMGFADSGVHYRLRPRGPRPLFWGGT